MHELLRIVAKLHHSLALAEDGLERLGAEPVEHKKVEIAQEKPERHQQQTPEKVPLALMPVDLVQIVVAVQEKTGQKTTERREQTAPLAPRGEAERKSTQQSPSFVPPQEVGEAPPRSEQAEKSQKRV